ncbi:hypothetical protein FRC00_003934 [Tulasnella sp. 408]|nr:hypothetical protein FRC00_003934 [Tulasnella sp. 408]
MDVTTLTQLNSPDRIHVASPHPIHTLPIELLNLIFLHLYRDQSIPRATDAQRSTHKLTFIMLVCKHWKEIVECSPILWTDIWLSRPPEHVDTEEDWIGWLEALFKRSRTLPLTLTIILSFVDFEGVGQVLLQHLPRCKTLVLQPPEGRINWITPRSLRVSAVHRILSSPFPILRKIVIDGHNSHYDSDHQGPLLLDAPNLRSFSSSIHYIIPFVKACGSTPAHNSLESFSINGGWQDVLEMLPRTAVSLPELKSLSLTYTDDLWNILQILDAPNLERFSVDCSLANWFEEIHTPTPVLSNLRELTWYTEPRAQDEAPNLRHLLQHCPNIERFRYSVNSSSVYAKPAHLTRQDVDSLILALSDPLDETHNSPPRLCPRLKHLYLVYATLEQVRVLVVLRPSLEYVALQYREPGNDTIAPSKAAWREKVDLVLWIRSKIEFDFEEDGGAVGPAL